jgi:hypothetical protein
MPSFDSKIVEVTEHPGGGCTVILKPNELEKATNLSEVLIEPKFATNGGAIYADHIELYCAQKPAVCEGQWLMIRTLDPYGE